MNTPPSARPVPVVIPTLNEADHIAEVIGELSQDPPVQGLRFLVVDGGSTDGTREIIQRLVTEGVAVEIIDNPAKLQAAGVNIAAARLTEPAFVRCDAHSAYPPGFVATLVATMAETGAESVVVPMRSVGKTCFQTAVAAVSNSPVGTGGSRHRSGTVRGWIDHGHHAAFQTVRFNALGGYTETFVANEDAEYDARLKASGGRVFMEPEAEIVYYPRSSARTLARQYFRYGYGRASTGLKHPGSLRVRQMAVPAAIASFLLGLLFSPILPWAALWPATYAGILAVVSVAFAIRSRSGCGLFAGPVACIMHVSWAAGFASRLAARNRDT